MPLTDVETGWLDNLAAEIEKDPQGHDAIDLHKALDLLGFEATPAGISSGRPQAFRYHPERLRDRVLLFTSGEVRPGKATHVADLIRIGLREA